MPTAELAAHGVIEFGNRLLTFVLAAVAIATVVVVWRSGRAGICARWPVLSFLGIPAQALLGGDHRADRAQPVDGRRALPGLDGARRGGDDLLAAVA